MGKITKVAWGDRALIRLNLDEGLWMGKEILVIYRYVDDLAVEV